MRSNANPSRVVKNNKGFAEVSDQVMNLTDTSWQMNQNLKKRKLHFIVAQKTFGGAMKTAEN